MYPINVDRSREHVTLPFLPRLPPSFPASPFSLSSLKPGPASERVGHGEGAGAVERVDAQGARVGGHDAAFLLLGVFVGAQPGHAMQRDAGAVERRADLARAVEAVAAAEEAPGGAAAAHVALHRVPAVRLPFAHEGGRGE